ncbi:Heterokaryon incompatibility protein 6, OR allele [Cytospora mali]|uniref:Heterokaryon incompatibility protein 6, OR allele n=1 Tax=Cytospora mali TaxID=578113 RepID=A0A194V2K8_CYTMA|nr:Heterokaryon incompatibility protein 6, OR allele [Valsa mali var. pyri (nom. inval.)]
MATAYRYSPLSPDTDDIRLLTLKPGKEADGIAITLQHCPLVAAAGQYEAFSYVWGSTDDPTTIEVEGVLPIGNSFLSITQNLAVALRHLRSPDVSRIFWIDAICIDQQTRQESSEQVLRMGDIYGMAARVEDAAVELESRTRYRILSIADSFNMNQNLSLAYLVCRTQLLKCADPRDKIYAILGIASDIQHVKPDYTLTTMQVYRDVMVHKMYSNDLKYLRYCEIDNRKLSGPTWVPDWSSPMKTERLWNTCAASSAWAPVGMRRDLELFRISAIRVGFLCQMDELSIPTFDMNLIASQIARLAPAQVDSLTYKTGCSSLLEAFCARWRAWTLPPRAVLKCTSQLYRRASRPFVTVFGGRKGAYPLSPTTSVRILATFTW